MSKPAYHELIGEFDGWDDVGPMGVMLLDCQIVSEVIQQATGWTAADYAVFNGEQGQLCVGVGDVEHVFKVKLVLDDSRE